MQRRQFLTTSTLAGTASLAAAQSLAGQGSDQSGPRKFKLQYAPHFNMFKNSAGEDPIDQLKWAADQGFTQVRVSSRPRFPSMVRLLQREGYTLTHTERRPDPSETRLRFVKHLQG